MASFLAFSGSNSSNSINFALVRHTVSLIDGHQVQLLNMANMPFPMYSEDYEREKGFSNALIELKNDLQRADGLIISVNEHNSNPSAYTKNLLDWLSRLELKFLEDSKVFLMSASRGRRGGASSRQIIEALLPRFGAEVIATFSLPSFRHSFVDGKGIVDEELKKEHREALDKFLSIF